MGKTGDGGEYQSTARNLLISPCRKIFLDMYLSPTIKSVIPSTSNRNFYLITLYKLHLQLQSLLLYYFFKFRLYIYRHVIIILIKQCLLNVILSITKELNGKISPKQHFYYLHLSMLDLENSACLSARFPLFHSPFFISNVIKFQLTPLQLGLCGLSVNKI